MWSITIVAVGKIKEAHFQEAIGEYAKRFAPFTKLSFQELKAEPFRGEGDKLKAQATEGERILAFLEKRSDSEVFILSENGKRFSSPAFARYLESIQRPIIFVIGGALGIHESVTKKYKNIISLSDMTFPHEMARMILAEQIYRAITIIKQKDYHY